MVGQLLMHFCPQWLPRRSLPSHGSPRYRSTGVCTPHIDVQYPGRNKGVIRRGDFSIGDSMDDSRLRELVKEEVYKNGTGASVAVQKPSDNGVFLLCLANALVYLFDHVLRIGFISKSLYLYHSFARPWQFVTSAFCHASWQHLSSNIFMLYVFGKIIEEEEGAFGVILTYIVGAVGGAIAGYFTLPQHSVSVGASGAVFCLFIVAVLIKLKWSVKKLLEAGILGQFVFQQLSREVQMQMGGGASLGGSQISHIAHLGGAAAGGLLVLLLMRLPDEKA